ncbi:MAG: TIM barrel protein, partial [Planctomycetota bacterium]
TGGPWIFWDDLEVSIPRARAFGFDAAELFTASADAVNSKALFRLLDREGIRLAAVGTGAGKALHDLHLVSPDKSKRRKACQFIAGMIDFGARFGAPAIIGSMQGHLEEGGRREQALAWLSEGLNQVGEKAADYGMPLLADLFHMNIEEESIGDSIRAAGDCIGHVHFVDSNRRPAGMGHIDFTEVAEALKDINYSGYASAEAFSYPDADSAAVQTITAFRKFLVPQGQ